MLRRPSITYKH